MSAVTAIGWHLRDPQWLWLLAIALALLLLRATRRPRVPLAAPPDGGRLPSSWRSRSARLPALLEGAAVALAVLALARPVHEHPAAPERLVRDVMLCLDRSSSMATTDLAPRRTRLQVAIEMATRFVDMRGGDRIGCLEFARYPDLCCPPTLDHEAGRELLSGIALVAADGPEDATGIGAALAAAAEVLGRSPAPGRVIVLCTDGSENVATQHDRREIAPLHAAQLCAQLGIRVHTIVVGRGERAPDGTFVPLDTSVVQQIAAATGGRSFLAADAAALQAVGAAIDALEPAAFAEPRRVVREWFAELLAAAVGVLFAARWLGRWLWEVVP